MNNKILRKAETYRKTHTKKQWLYRGLSVLAAGAVFCTTYALILPAITMESGTLEHRHDESCYAYTAETKIFACTALPHEHTDGCWDTEGKPICGYADYFVHAHDESCYDEEGTLLCELPEIGIHEHGEECFEPEEILLHEHTDECIGMEKGELICEIEESEGHVHDETCVGIVSEMLICELTEAEPHGHVAECYEIIPTDELICTEEEVEAHSHSESCYDTVINNICGLEESEEHPHEDSCFEESSEMICVLDETAGHTHSAECYGTEEILVCEAEETEGHTHGEGCYEIVTDNTCGQEESEAHQHEDSCYEWTEILLCEAEAPEEEQPAEEEAEPICGFDEVILHTHEEECFDEDGAWVCGITEVLEHRHSEECCTVEITEYEEPVLICGLEEYYRTAEDCAAEFAELVNTMPDPADEEYYEAYYSVYDIYMVMYELYFDENPNANEDQFINWLYDLDVLDAYFVFIELSDAFVSQKNFSESVQLDDTSFTVSINGKFPENSKLIVSERNTEIGVDEEDSFIETDEKDITVMSTKAMQLFSAPSDNGSDEIVETDTSSRVWSLQYDMKILIGDYEWQPNEKVQVKLTTDYPCDVDEIRVVHYLDTPEAIIAAQQQGTAQYYFAENITELFPRENEALLAVDVAMTDAVCYTVLSSENGEVTCNGNVISFETDSFSIFSVNGYNDLNKKELLTPNSTITMKRGDVQYFMWEPTPGTTNTGRGTWTVEAGDEYVDFEVYNSNLSADGSTGDTTNFYQYYWLKLKAKEPSGTEKATIQFEYATTGNDGYIRVQEYFYVQVLETDNPLYVDDQVAENGCLVPTFTQDINTEGFTYEWTRDDGEPVNPVALEAPYAIVDGAVNIAMDRGGIDAEDANTDSPMKTYTVTVKNGDIVIGTAEYTVPYGNELLNGSFEFPKSVHVTHDYPNGAPGLYWKTTSESVVANEICQDIEILSVNVDSKAAILRTYGISRWVDPTIYFGPDSIVLYDGNLSTYIEPDYNFPDGVQCAEINCDAPGALYQDILTYPGTSMYWQLHHRGRNYSDSSGAYGGAWLPDGHSYTVNGTTLTDQKDYMYVIAAPTAQVEHIKTQDQLNELIKAAGYPVNDFTSQRPTTQYSFDANGKEVTYNSITFKIWEVATDHTAWKQYASTSAYEVGEGEYLTRFFFAAGSTSHDRAHVANGNAANYSGGNFIDKVSFSDEMPWRIEYYKDGVLLTTLTESGRVALNRDTMRYPLNKTASYDSTCNELKDTTLVKTEINGRPYTGTTLEEVYTNHNVLQLYFETYGVTVTKKVVIKNEIDMTPAEKEELEGILEDYKVTFNLFKDETRVATAIVTIDPETRIGSATFYDDYGKKFEPDRDEEYRMTEGDLPNVNELILSTRAEDKFLTGEIVYANTVENIYEMKLYVDVTLNKVSSNFQPLGGAVFSLIDANNVEREITVDQNGQYRFEKLRIGQLYTLIEKKAPDGYMMLTDAVYFKPERDNIILCDENGDPIDPMPNITTSYGDGSLSITVKNHAGTELPSTGGIGTFPYTLGGLMIVGASAILFMYKSRRKQRD